MIKARLLLSISHSYIEDCLDGFFVVTATYVVDT